MMQKQYIKWKNWKYVDNNCKFIVRSLIFIFWIKNYPINYLVTYRILFLILIHSPKTLKIKFYVRSVFFSQAFAQVWEFNIENERFSVFYFEKQKKIYLCQCVNLKPQWRQGQMGQNNICFFLKLNLSDRIYGRR